MGERILAFLFVVFLAVCFGWWLHGHPDKLFQYTGWFGNYFAQKVEKVQPCPDGFTCTKN